MDGEKGGGVGRENDDDDNSSLISDIFQGDGADTISEVSESDDDLSEDEGDNMDAGQYITDVEDEEVDDDVEEGDDNEDEEQQFQQSQEENIPVIVSHRTNINISNHRGLPVLRTVGINKRVAASAELPTIAVTNFRSLGPRVQAVKDDMLLRDLEVQIGSESWEKESNEKLKSDIEGIFQLHGIQYISCPRPNKKRGGGVSILVNTRRFTITKINILDP